MPIIINKNDNNYFNLNKERNEQNMNNFEYNCGGYALGTFTWYHLESFNHGEFFIEEIENYIDQIENSCIEEIIKDFNGLVRPISILSELRENEYAVLFRISYNDEGYIDDFHFIKRHHDGHYSHKPGNTPITEFEGDPFDGDWTNIYLDYNAPIKILAVSNLLY